MPYIEEADRLEINDGRPPHTAGELNYLLTLLAIWYIEENGLNYAHINDVLGAFSGASAEFYRRVAAPYEDGKIKSNGDVYPSAPIG